MSTLLDEETVILDGLDFQPPCEQEDGKTAKFLMLCRGCRKGPMLCAECVTAWKQMVDRWQNVGATVNCKHCLRSSRSFHEAVEVVAL